MIPSQNQAVFRYLEANLTSRLTVKQVAKSLSISESGLTKRFRAETGISPGKYVNLLIIQKAKHMLLHTNFSIGEIAEKLDFCDQFYFARFFRLKTGETPSLFRQRSLGES